MCSRRDRSALNPSISVLLPYGKPLQIVLSLKEKPLDARTGLMSSTRAFNFMAKNEIPRRAGEIACWYQPIQHCFRG